MKYKFEFACPKCGKTAVIECDPSKNGATYCIDCGRQMQQRREIPSEGK